MCANFKNAPLVNRLVQILSYDDSNFTFFLFKYAISRFYQTPKHSPASSRSNGIGYCGGNGGVGKLPSRTVIQILEKVKLLLMGLPSLLDIQLEKWYADLATIQILI